MKKKTTTIIENISDKCINVSFRRLTHLHTDTTYYQSVEIVPEQVLVLFQPEQHRFGPVSEHFFVPVPDDAKRFR